MEAEIIWLKPKENYEYLRESVMTCNFRARFPLKSHDPAKCTDGGPLAHIVAYATLSRDTPSDGPFRGWGYFERRYWWVKSYDRFKGCNGEVYSKWEIAPAEAVEVDSIRPNLPSRSFGSPEMLAIE